MRERANSIRQCTNPVTKVKDVRTIKGSVMIKNTAGMGELNKVRLLTSGHNMLVYWKKEGWKEYTLIRVNDSEVGVILPTGIISSFTVCSVCTYYSILNYEKILIKTNLNHENRRNELVRTQRRRIGCYVGRGRREIQHIHQLRFTKNTIWSIESRDLILWNRNRHCSLWNG